MPQFRDQCIELFTKFNTHGRFLMRV
jgi:hypothetical protein